MTVTFPPLHQSNLWCCASIVVILIVVFLPPELAGLIDARRLCTGGRAFMWLRQLFENNAKDNAWDGMHSGTKYGSKWKSLIFSILLFLFSSLDWIFSNALYHCATINKPAPCLPARQSALLVTLSALPVQLHTTHTHFHTHTFTVTAAHYSYIQLNRNFPRVSVNTVVPRPRHRHYHQQHFSFLLLLQHFSIICILLTLFYWHYTLLSAFYHLSGIFYNLFKQLKYKWWSPARTFL